MISAIKVRVTKDEIVDVLSGAADIWYASIRQEHEADERSAGEMSS